MSKLRIVPSINFGEVASNRLEAGLLSLMDKLCFLSASFSLLNSLAWLMEDPSWGLNTEDVYLAS